MVLKTFNEIIEKILEHEGGYVNDPTDMGGETKYGITKRFYPNVDIKNLTVEQAKKIYHQDYWRIAKVDDIPDNLKHMYFDMCVNMGTKRAIKILQKSANSKGHKLVVDGKIGSKTINALSNVELKRVKAYRIKYYADLVSEKPNQEKFYYGWVKRVLDI